MNVKLLKAYQEIFGNTTPFVIRSPGRVNVIGEHTDYNDGFVFPIAIDQATWITASPRNDSKILAYSLNFKELRDIDIDDHTPPEKITWPEYLRGVGHAFKETFKKPLLGFNAVIHSDVPMGAGLSSSASFELAIAKTLSHVNHIPWDKIQMARLCQKAENEWVGVHCGIMDQLICAIAEKDHASLIDCRDFSSQPALLPQNTVIIILDTDTRRGLVASAYNERRSQCESAADLLGINALRDISYEQLLQKESLLDPIVFKRAKHVVSENERTLRALEAMRNQDSALLGALLYQSHQSLDQDYEVTNESLNVMVECAIATPGCYGARMTGAGFGGCAVALVEKNMADNFKETVAKRYEERTGLVPSIYVTNASEGCACIEDVTLFSDLL